MKLRQYTAALAQIVQATLSRGMTSPVLVLDGDRLWELHGLERPRDE